MFIEKVWHSYFIRTNHETHPKVSSGMVIVLEKAPTGNHGAKSRAYQGDKDAKPCMQWLATADSFFRQFHFDVLLAI